jgi:hypothetical protein
VLAALGYITAADKLPGRERNFRRAGSISEAARQQQQGKHKPARRLWQPNGESNLTEQAAPTKFEPSREMEAGSAEEQPAEG